MSQNKIHKMGKIRNEIIEKLENAGIMLFIIEEVSYSLKYLNYYKLQNIQENINIFIGRITNLNNSYIESLKNKSL